MAPGVKRTRLSEVPSIRGPVAAATASAAAAASNVRRPRHKNRRRSLLHLHSLYYIRSCYVHLLLKTGTTWLCMVAFLASRKNAFFAPCLCQREASQVGTLVKFQAMPEKTKLCMKKTKSMYEDQSKQMHSTIVCGPKNLG